MSELDDSELSNAANKLFKHVAVDFLIKNVPQYNINETYNAPDSDADPLQLMKFLEVKDTGFSSQLQPIFSAENGEIVTFEERFYDEEAEEGNSQRSMSLRRAPNAKSFNNLRGSTSNVPFLPGGFDEEMEKLFRLTDREEEHNEEEQPYLDALDSELLEMLPGFDKQVCLSNTMLQLPVDNPSSLLSNSTDALSHLCPNEDNVEDILDALTDMIKDNSPVKASKKLRTSNMNAISTKSSIVKTKTPQNHTESVSVNEPAAGISEEAVKVAEALEKNVAPNIDDRIVKRRTALQEDQFMYAQMIDLTRPPTKYAELKPSMAKSFPFELDLFQQHAVVSMEDGTSVFIAAHTSAGKTVVAEYAIALCKINKTRVIYTSPIKALSNQKYRDFKLTFEDVGLVTGDIQLNTDAFCLIMTTEVLRSMIYNGSETIRELEWVIFDEVHYINDKERGYVWEEILIMLPLHVKIVMLSATVPNCMEFADWVGRIKNRKIHVIQTLKRPVPLEHYLYTGKDGRTKGDRFLILDKNGEFLHYNYKKAVEAKKKSMTKNSAPDKWQYAHANDRNIYINLIDHLRSKDLLPMVVFVFSRKRCDQAASLLQSMDLTSAKEKSEIHKFFTKCIDRLRGSDRQLPQLMLMQEHCKRGFAVHHSGVLPIIKEVVELLFQRGYVKILFATETFAMGVNMPARTVVFDTIEKFDGNSQRFLNATEYVQMAGRAGRRGLDSTGTVIIVSKGHDPPDINCLTHMLTGKTIHLESRFRITYGMILNLLRVEQLRIEDMLQRSFVERTSLRLMSSRKEQLQNLIEEIRQLPTTECSVCLPESSGTTMQVALSSLSIFKPLVKTRDQFKTPMTASIVDYFDTLRTYIDETPKMWSELVLKFGLDKLFNVGRMVIINYPPLGLYGRLATVLQARRYEEGIFSITVLIAADRELVSNAQGKLKAFENLTTESRKQLVERNFLTYYAMNGLETIQVPSNADQPYSRHSYYVIERLGLDSLAAICKKTLKIQDTDVIMCEFHGLRQKNRDVSPTNVLHYLVSQLNDLAKWWKNLPSPKYTDDAVQLLSSKPIYLLGKDITKSEINIHGNILKLRDLREQLIDVSQFPCRTCPAFEDHFKNLLKRVQLEEQQKLLIHQTSSEGLQMSGDYSSRLNVLKVLDYVDKNNMTGLKGKVACEINNQELLITELMLENKFDGLTCPEIAALLSPLTCNFSAAAKSASSTASTVGSTKVESNIKIVPADSAEQVNFNSDDIVVNKSESNMSTASAKTSKERKKRKNFKEEVVERAPAAVIEKLKQELIDVASRIDAVQESCGIHIFVTSELSYGLMEVAYQWANGMPFADIMKLTDAQEGIIVRCIQRLDEILKDVRKAARIIGNPDLYEHMEATSAAIKRDIVFAASLYTVEE